MNKKVIFCRASTDSHKLAESIFIAYKEDATRELAVSVIGAGALNQAIKAVIISEKLFERSGLRLLVSPEFVTTENNMSAIELKVVVSNFEVSAN